MPIISFLRNPDLFIRGLKDVRWQDNVHDSLAVSIGIVMLSGVEAF